MGSSVFSGADRSARRADSPSRATVPLLAGAGAAVLLLVGCTSNVSASGEPADAEVTPLATGIVVVEGTVGSDGTESRSQAVARFVRARPGPVDDDALRMVGASVDFPALGACESLAALRAGASASTLALVDVGGVTLSAGDALTSLQARQLPDVADLVSGVVYSARADELPTRSHYMLRIDGSPDQQVSAFVVSAASPGEPAGVRVAGDDGRAGPVTIATGPVELAWEPGSAEDVVYVDVAASGDAPATRCLFDDVGRAVLPAAAFGALEDGTLAVHRLHREYFHARGVEPGEVRFDFARTVSFARR
jgi:hypothetical protein